MPAPLFRFVVYGLLAVSCYTVLQWYSSSGEAPKLQFGNEGHSIGSLGHGLVLKDGRKSISRRTVAVADLHGDLEHALNVLRMASIVAPAATASDAHQWIAGHDVLVSTGDIVDRGDDTIALYRLFQSLRKQAASAGGQVKNLLGNHEVMNAIGDWRYVTPGDTQSFGGAAERRRIMSDQGWIGQDWLNNFNITTIVSLLPSDHPGLPSGYKPPSASFVHGGITAEYAATGIDSINTLGHSFLSKGLAVKTPRYHLPPNTTDQEQRLYSEFGPLWYRGYALDNEAEACKHAAKAKELLGVRHLVMGHTPHFDGFVVRCAQEQSSILLIDTGISRAYGGEQSALIIDMQLTPVDRQRDGKKLWIETETLTALYKGRLPKIIAQIEQQLWL